MQLGLNLCVRKYISRFEAVHGGCSLIEETTDPWRLVVAKPWGLGTDLVQFISGTIYSYLGQSPLELLL